MRSMARPTRVNDSTTSTTQMPGGRTYHHAPWLTAPVENALSRIAPHDGASGSPRPRKDSVVSDRITIATVSDTLFVQVADSLAHRREATLESALTLLLPILLLLPLIWLVWGFFAHSAGMDSPAEEPARTRADHLQHAAIWVFITACWGFLLFDNWRDPQPDGIMVGLLAIAVGGGLFEVVSTLRKARAPAA